MYAAIPKLKNLRKRKIHMTCLQNLLKGPANCDINTQKKWKSNSKIKMIKELHWNNFCKIKKNSEIGTSIDYSIAWNLQKLNWCVILIKEKITLKHLKNC